MSSALQAYRLLDFSRKSDSVADLMSKAPTEAARQGCIDLTGAGNRYEAKAPAGLTPAMAAWYSAYVAGARTKAIAEINNLFHNEKVPEGTPHSTFFELKRDEVRGQALANRISDTREFLNHNRDLIDRFNRARTEFNTLKSRLGREPVKPRPAVYIGALLLLVLLEAFINFESFLKVPYITSPFLATGATMAVAFAIAAAAHFHGTVLKQWSYLFSPQDPGDSAHASRRSDATRRLVMGGVLLLFALAMVAGSRYYYLREYIVQARILGSSPPSMAGGIAFMLFGNVVAYLVAVLVAYSLHDANPNYAEKDKELRRTTRLLDVVKARRRAALENHQKGMENALAGEANHASNSRGANHHLLRSQVDQLIEKDQEVLAALQDYRNELVAAFDGKADEARFLLPEGAHEDLLPGSIDRMLTPRQYAAEPMNLGFAAGDGR